MTDHPRGTERPAETSMVSALRWDARMLRKTMRRAIRTSPDSFLMTVEDIAAKPLRHWVDEIQSSTWAVAQRGRGVVGIVRGKRPDSDKDEEDQAFTRYIESVWIAPELRGHGLGERLIKYLLEAEYRKNQRIKQFLLWVFATNSSAIRLYEQMGFKRTAEKIEGDRTEIKYRLDFDSDVDATVDLTENEADRRQDKRRFGVTYRVLGEDDVP